MVENNSESQKDNDLLQLKQIFLSEAISNITGNIHFLDTKVSIIMAAVLALIGGVGASLDRIELVLKNIYPCSWLGILLLILTILCLISIIGVFIFGINTIRGRKSEFQNDSGWFINYSVKEYPFEDYESDIFKKNSEEIIKDMAAELYKLNDINKQKMETMDWVIITFSGSLIFAFVIGSILLLVGG